MNYAKSALSYFTLKRCYKYLLKRLFGSFIVHEDINLDQLDVDLYKGQVKLENIHIQAEKINSILSSLNVPLIMVKGTINQIHLSVPWKHVFSQRCKVYFEGVDLHFAMRNEVAVDRSGLSQGEMGGPVRPGGPDGHATRSYMEAVEESHVPDGVEALTRLVQHILVNLEVCLADATVTLHPGGWDTSVETGQPKIWATMKELLIYSDTETHHLPDASPKPAESEEFSEELPASPIDSKGMSLLSVEVFVARDDDASKLLHTGGKPIRLGLRRVVENSSEGRRSDGDDEDQTATLEIEAEVEHIYADFDHPSCESMLEVFYGTINCEEKFEEDETEQNHMFYSVMESTPPPPRSLSAAERAKMFWLEMYRLFDLDSKLEALCTSEEEADMHVPSDEFGFRDDEPIQDLAAFAPPGEEFWFDQVIFRFDVGGFRIGADFWLTAEQPEAILLGTLTSLSIEYSWSPSGGEQDVNEGESMMSSFRLSQAGWSVGIAPVDCKSQSSASSPLGRESSFYSSQHDGSAVTKDSSPTSSPHSCPASIGVQPASAAAAAGLEEVFFDRRGVHRLVEEHCRLLQYTEEKSAAVGEWTRIVWCDHDAVSITAGQGPPQSTLGDIEISLDLDVVCKVMNLKLPTLPTSAEGSGLWEDQPVVRPVTVDIPAFRAKSVSVNLWLKDPSKEESLPRSRTAKVFLTDLVVQRNTCRIGGLAVSDCEGGMAGDDRTILLETQSGPSGEAAASLSLWRVQSDMQRDDRRSSLSSSRDRLELQFILPSLTAPSAWHPKQIGSFTRCLLDFAESIPDLPPASADAEASPGIGLSVYIDRLSMALVMGGDEADVDLSFRMCAFRVTPVGMGRHCMVEAGEVYLGSVLRPWVLRDLEAASKFPNSCEVEGFVEHSLAAAALKVEADLPERGAVESGRVIATLKRMQGVARPSEVASLSGVLGFMEEVSAEVTLGRGSVDVSEETAMFYLLLEDCLVEGALLDASVFAPAPDPNIGSRDVRGAITFTGEAAFTPLPPNASTRTVKVHIAEVATWLLDASGCKIGKEAVLPSQSSKTAGSLLKEIGFAPIGVAKGGTLVVATAAVPVDAQQRARVALDVHHIEVSLCADSLACVSSISAWISSLIPSPDDTPNPPSSITRQNDEDAPEKSGRRLCVIEDFDEGDAQPSDSPPAVTPMEPLSLEEEVSVWEDEDDPWPTHGDSDAHNASPSNLSSQESLPPPPSRRETLDCYGGVETSATWFAPLDGALINGEHFGCSVGGSSSAGRATPMRSSSGATTLSRGPQEGPGLLDGLEVRVTAAQVELKLYDGKDWSERHGTSASLRQVRMSTRAKRPTICAKLKDVGVTVISKPAPSSSTEGQQQISLWLSIGDVTIIDLLQASVYQYILVYYEGNKGDHPKGTNVSMVLLRFDSSPGGRSSENTQISHSRLEISILPLRLTIDQDTLHWLDAFADSVNMYVYAAMDVEAPLFEDEEEGESTVKHIMPSTTTIRIPSPPGVWLDSVKISELLVCIDYRCKRVNMRRLRRGDRAELINLLPILEGLEVKFRSAHLQSIRSVSQLSELLIDRWKGDMSKARMLRSICRMTPIRSLTNITSSLTELLSLPLLQYRYASPIDSVARDPRTGRRLGWWRQLSEFATCLTIESLTSIERAVSTTQTVLEAASQLVDTAPTAQSSASSSSSSAHAAALEWTAVECVDDGDPTNALPSVSVEDDDDDEEWLSVERGAVRDRQFAPTSRVEQLQFVTQRLSREIQNAGRDALVGPLQEYAHGRASTESVVVSVARGVPLCILRPAAGATEAVSVALRTATSSLDQGKSERERERKFKGPGVL